MKEKDLKQKNYNVEELYVARLKSDESAIYYIAEIHESLKGFLINTKNKKPQLRELLTGYIINYEDVKELESLCKYYSPLELPKQLSQKEILEQYIVINELKNNSKNEYSDVNIENKVINKKMI